MKKKKKYWAVCVVLMVILTVLGYTPVITPPGVYKPMLFGVPYSLWTSIVITVAMVVLTFIGSKVHPGSDTEEGES